MADLRDIPSGSFVFVDTNIFTYHFCGKSVTCTTFLQRIADGDITAYVNTEVLSDLLHKMMLAEAFQKNIINRPTAVKLKKHLQQNRTAIERLPNHQQLFEQLMKMGLKVIRITKKMLINTKRERKNHGLMTNDSLHLGSMVYHSIPIQNIATRDGDFFHVSGVSVWEPTDVVD